MADTPHSRPSASRLPDWWRTKPLALPDATSEPRTGTAPDWWDALYGGADQESPCSHKHTISVHARPTDELVALICTDCDEQLPPPEPEDEEREPSPGWLRPAPGYYPRPHAPAFITEAPAPDAISPKTRAALYNASAAGAGWGLGLYGVFADAIASCGTDYGISGALVLGLGGCLVIAHFWDRRTRHWWPGLAWVARIPLATAVLALALWAPAAP